MNLVPESAIIQQAPERTFAEMRQGMVVTNKNLERRFDEDPLADVDVSIGCGNTYPSVGDNVVTATTGRRRLQHVGGPEDCNNSTNFFCWMSCLEIPQANNAQGFLNEGYSLYCVDPAVLVSTGNQVSKAVEPCNEAGQIGRAMNSNCMGVWQPTAPGVPAQEVVVQGATNNVDADSFCYGGTVMYMDGFNWVGSTCAIYLFPGWILSSMGKFVAACLGTVLFGVAVEYSIRKRQQVIAAMAPGRRRLVLSAAFKAVQLFMGYIIMLIVMIHSAPPFISAITGLVIGHVLFNAKDCLVQVACSKMTAVLQRPSSLTKDRKETHPLSSSESFCDPVEKTEAAGPDEQEGITPCCQN